MYNNIEYFQKEIGLISTKEFENLSNSHIILCGLGGVGSYTFEMLVRVGIGNITIIDFDKIEVTNINRQLETFIDNIGLYKTDVYKDRAIKINPNIIINKYNRKITENNVGDFINLNIKNDFIVDCIDDVTAKIALAKFAVKNNIKIISCMGTANHIETKNIKISLLSKTKYCPLAKNLRSELYNNNKIDIMTLYIDEEPMKIDNNINKISTISYVVATCGNKLAEYVIKNLI